ncbi:hypothetical protein [Streptomyces sp. NPDC017890]|uniref:hypothetical protein n=1 Tax=Streptomyces sp. NPDC017890 TaxID=3365015 RepID=UPI00378B20CC
MAYAIGLVWMSGASFMTWKAAQLWRNAHLVDFFLASFAVLPFGQEVRRGEVRSVGVTATSLWAIAPLVFLGLLDAEMTGSSSRRPDRGAHRVGMHGLRDQHHPLQRPCTFRAAAHAL